MVEKNKIIKISFSIEKEIWDQFKKLSKKNFSDGTKEIRKFITNKVRTKKI